MSKAGDQFRERRPRSGSQHRTTMSQVVPTQIGTIGLTAGLVELAVQRGRGKVPTVDGREQQRARFIGYELVEVCLDDGHEVRWDRYVADAGVGNAKFLYGQIVDDATGLVLGNQVQPIPVTLDGKTRTVKVKLENVVYTMEPGSSLTLQLTGSATVYLGALLTPALGALTVSDLELTLPTVADGVATLEPTGP